MIFSFLRGLLCIFQIFFNEVFYFHNENTNIFFERRKYLVTRQRSLKLLTDKVAGTGMSWPPSPEPGRPPRGGHMPAPVCGARGARAPTLGWGLVSAGGVRALGSKQHPWNLPHWDPPAQAAGSHPRGSEAPGPASGLAAALEWDSGAGTPCQPPQVCVSFPPQALGGPTTQGGHEGVQGGHVGGRGALSLSPGLSAPSAPAPGRPSCSGPSPSPPGSPPGLPWVTWGGATPNWTSRVRLSVPGDGGPQRGPVLACGGGTSSPPWPHSQSARSRHLVL